MSKPKPIWDLIRAVLLTLGSIFIVIMIGAMRRAVIFPAAAAIIGVFWIRQAWLDMKKPSRGNAASRRRARKR